MKLTPLSKIVIVVALSGLAYAAARSTNLLPKPSVEVVQPPAEPAPGAAPAPTRAVDTLRLAGSNTIGAELMPALAEAFLRTQSASDVHREPLASPVETKVVGEIASAARAFEIKAHGTSTAFTALRDGTADIAMASRRIKPEERQSLEAFGDMTSPSREHVLAVDGVAVIVHADRALNSLGIRDLARVFAGEVTDFGQVQAGTGSIRLYARDAASGTFDTFESLVLRNTPLSSSARRFEDGAALVTAVAGDVRGIGFVSLSQASSSSGVHTIAIAEPGATALLPTRLTVATEDYPLSRRLYLYVAKPEDARSRAFVEFALSKAGQEIVAKSGFVALTPESTSTTPQTNLPPNYQKLTDGASRLSTNFRFQTGASELDNRALRDLDRVAELMIDLDHGGDKLLLLGFSDSTGSASANQQLSQTRAEHVAAAFRQRGLSPSQVRGFGAALPVGDNSTPEGREKNRRVEVWIQKKH